MIENLLLSILLGFVNPVDPTGKTMYPSGVKDCDNVIYTLPPHATKNPDMVLHMPVYDSEKNIILPGIYEAKMSENHIILLQSGEIKARLPVSQVISLDKECRIPTVTVKNLSTRHILVIYKNENIEAYSTLYAP